MKLICNIYKYSQMNAYIHLVKICICDILVTQSDVVPLVRLFGRYNIIYSFIVVLRLVPNMEVIKVLTSVTLLFVLLSLGTVLAIVWSMDDLPSNFSNEKLCLPTEQSAIDCQTTPIRLRTFLTKAIAKEYRRIKQVEKEKMDQYFSIESNRLSLKSIYDNAYWEMKPAARVTGKTSKTALKNKKENEMETIRDWCHGRELRDNNGFLAQGIRYNKGRLVVPVSGVYFLYSFIDFYEPCVRENGKPDIDNIKSPIKHGIYKFNILEGQEKEVILSHQPHKYSINRYFNSYSSYITSLAELTAGDEIYVKVSNITNIDQAEDNFFGLNLI